ncbi:hypothetical protein [Enterovirga sp. CN4-39]|uniref:hypothetical protein n=1 Tax=Enterovirga sp. CN4-39 TaxID=3400910 RepID=UPI003BFCCA4D
MPEQPPPYNPIFTRFVELERGGDEQIQGLIAYGLYKVAKREWVRGISEVSGLKPTETQLADYAATWTESRLKGLEDQAQNALARFAEVVVEENTPSIREEALRGTSWKSIGTSIAANFIYTLLLIAIVVLLRVAGVDLLSIAGSVGTGGQAPNPAATTKPGP